MVLSASAELLSFLARLRGALPPSRKVYLVGGAVRDILLGRPAHDLDFVMGGEVLPVGRRVADSLRGAYYPLDEGRDTARVILAGTGGHRRVLDFSTLRGPDLESDLHARDFTINAMALAVDEPQVLIDPLQGAADLRAGHLSACAATAFQEDPLRVVRGARLAAGLGLYILPETRQWMREAIPSLTRVSTERLRDELFRILDSPQAVAAIRALDALGALKWILPELESLKEVHQSQPHLFDVWNHSLEALVQLKKVLNVLLPVPDEDAGANLALGLVSMRLGRFREPLAAHLAASLNPDRSLRSLLALAALYHDVAKPQTRQVEANGRTRFFEHDLRGAEIVKKRAQALHLSNEEIERLRLIVRHHMRPLLLNQGEELPSRRAVYRFFRDLGPAGVDVCLLSLADFLATYGPGLPAGGWARHLDVVRTLLEAWWEHPQEMVAPTPLLDGRDLMRALGLPPGREIGRLLEAVREAQATGQIHTLDQALELARQLTSGE